MRIHINNNSTYIIQQAGISYEDDFVSRAKGE
jgi:hypothetical protein